MRLFAQLVVNETGATIEDNYVGLEDDLLEQEESDNEANEVGEDDQSEESGDDDERMRLNLTPGI